MMDNIKDRLNTVLLLLMLTVLSTVSHCQYQIKCIVVSRYVIFILNFHYQKFYCACIAEEFICRWSTDTLSTLWMDIYRYDDIYEGQAVRSVYSRRGRIKQSFRFQEGKPTYTTHTSTYFIYTHRLPLQSRVPAARLYCNYTTMSPTTALRFTFKFTFLQMRTHPPLSYFYRWEQPWDGILGQQFNKGQTKSFAPCCSQSLLLADLKGNHSLLWFLKSLQKIREIRKLESIRE
jgi:hypothetical protein